jgi:hypothetical protein
VFGKFVFLQIPRDELNSPVPEIEEGARKGETAINPFHICHVPTPTGPSEAE